MNTNHEPTITVRMDTAWIAAIRRTPVPTGRIRRPAAGHRRAGRRAGHAASFATAFVLAVAVPFLAAASAGAQALPGYAPVTGVVAVDAGAEHSCAVTTGHRVLCWGSNNVGQLGAPGPAEPQRAVQVRNGAGTGPLSGATAIASGDYHSCAIVGGGEVRCWGANVYGQLGDGTTTERRLPIAVRAASGRGRLRGVTQISASGSTTCVRLASGEARCWGAGQSGQLGIGLVTDRHRPTPVRSVSGPGRLTGVAQVEVGGYHVCARLASGQARCWGGNGEGQLGVGSVDSHLRPVVVRNASNAGPLTAVRRISAGRLHTCAVLTTAQARCWGDDDHGTLGNGPAGYQTVPVVVVADPGGTPLQGVTDVVAAYEHSCARLANGQVRCWGSNVNDQLGNGVEAGPDVDVPTPVRNREGTGDLVGVAQVRSTYAHTCVALTNGQVRCWGLGQTGGLGDGGNDQQPLPQVVTREPVN